MLEIVFVLSMVAILVTWMTVSITTVESEQKLREAAGRIELLAKRGLNIAVIQQRPYELTIKEKTVSLKPKYATISDDFESIEVSGLGDDENNRSFDDITASEAMTADVSYEIKRWRSDEWQTLEKNQQMVISLSPLGLIEPISIRCSIGKSWIIHELHPLTAGIRDEEMSIEKE
ncbi:MAG: hypothetical protein P8P36_05480 [Akkermansiaceae bacterium]|nr:hypothetical protein [Akkermansiaceae bacterium]